MIIEESITEIQDVKFVLDSTSDLNLLQGVDLSKYQRAIVLCDEGLKENWWKVINPILSKQIEVEKVEFLRASEQTKGLQSFMDLANLLSDHKCTTDDVLVAIGGGTVLDVASFLASTYMRGMPFMMIPTTLIGQCDASTAGKTCINTKNSKNQVGTLYLPTLVYNNVSILGTCSEHDMRQGFSEIFKYALLGSQKLLDLLTEYRTNPTKDLMLEVLKETIAVRLKIRRKHPLSSNLGHTFGHAFEKYSGFAVDHGDAISIGMVMALEFSVEKGIIDSAFRDHVVSLMKSVGLNISLDVSIDPEAIVEIMLTDKKSSRTEIRLVLIEGIDKPYSKSLFYPVTPEEMKVFLVRFKAKTEYVRAGVWSELGRKI